ncbi:uncharacterized protein LY79DRAFT_660124 [Colletotrichum navitas]|uniref:Lysine-specific metallo-endopeptidase domain-containing protein n=1 Tax=Colletotrichum navitas TaxID=681940 RepID=A0AAD8PXZ4_9PEZI|nr:uncharacterized protein LY79DRAFT_660124 [Colletotrichum navitas]KAK1586171.1 hypothetical protein LY79DRAFT_660124 [Colletotrichum navitas]
MFAILLFFLPLLISATPLSDADIETRDLNTFDKVFWVNRGRYQCTSGQKADILAAINEAQVIVKKAVTALSLSRSEKSKAYVTWFGKGNASPQTRLSIFQHNYQSVATNLVPPTLPLRLEEVGWDVPFPATKKSLVYACEPEDVLINGQRMFAITRTANSGVPDFGPTYVSFYPEFFTQTTGLRIEEASKQWRLQNKLDNEVAYIRSLTLIHEFQHMSRVTGLGRHCIDVQHPTIESASCYSVDW